MGRGNRTDDEGIELVRRDGSSSATVSDLTQLMLAQKLSRPMQVLVVVLARFQESRHRAVQVETLKTALADIDWLALGWEHAVITSHLISNARKPSSGLIEFDGRGGVKLTPAGRVYAEQLKSGADQ